MRKAVISGSVVPLIICVIWNAVSVIGRLGEYSAWSPL